MADSLYKIVQNWRASQQSGREETFWAFLVRTNPWAFSHHPADTCFREHVWTIRGLHFCKGCSMTVMGWGAAVVLQMVTGWLVALPVMSVAALFVMLLLPSVITALVGAPRSYKHIARFLLGVLMMSAIWLFIITDEWWVRFVLAGVYLVVKVPLDRRRRSENQQFLRSHSAKASPGKRRTAHSHR